MAEVQAVRRGDFAGIAPDLFSDAFKRPIVANLIDTAARDMAAVLAPLPSFQCSAGAGLSKKAKDFADKRSKVVANYLNHCKFESQMSRGADQYNSYGLVVACVQPDFDNSTPYIHIEDSLGSYPVWNMAGETVELARIFYRDWLQLCADYPEVERFRKDRARGGELTGKVQVVKYVSKDKVVVYLPEWGNHVLENVKNPLGKCYYVAQQRPGLDDEIRGAYDDVIWTQLARHRIEMLKLEGLDKAVRAPLVVPPDVGDIPYGPDAVITTQHGAQSVQRAQLNLPAQVFTAGEQLRQEIQQGAMSPEGRSGTTDASVITGRGLQQLAAGFNSQIVTAQSQLKVFYERIIDRCFEMDEKLFGGSIKEIRGQDAGVPYTIKYNPTKDIDGDHTVDIAYGFATGLDPNRALVFLLQSQSAGLISRDFTRRALPVGLNAADEEVKLAVEASRDSLIQGLSALAQSIPQMVANGVDPTPILAQQAKFIKLLQMGKTVEEAATEALAPPPPEEPVAPEAPSVSGGQSEEASGFSQSGLPAGLQPNIATEGPQGRPDLESFFAGLGPSGSPVLTGGVSRMRPSGSQ